MSSMYAGTPGRGAADGAYATALEVEEARLQEEEFTGGVADIHKCFDQLLRALIYRLLEDGGFPKRVLRAYSGYLDHVQIHNSLMGCIGRGYYKGCSIPQGCPLSMMVMGYIMFNNLYIK